MFLEYLMRLRAGLIITVLTLCASFLGSLDVTGNVEQHGFEYGQSVAASGLLPALAMPYPGLDPDGPETISEVQAWWIPNYGHIHARARLPMGRSVKGDLTVPLQAIIHNNPSTLTTVQLLMRNGSNGDQPVVAGPINLSAVCPYNGTGDVECSHEWTFKVPTQNYPDGWKQFYLWVETRTPDGKDFRTSSRIPVRFANGNPTSGDASSGFMSEKSGCPTTSFLGRGWYDGLGPDKSGTYADAYSLCVPQGPVSGIMDLPLGGGYSISTSHLTVNVTKTHALPSDGLWAAQTALAGMNIFDKDGSFEGPFHYQLDTRILANGLHTIDTQVTYPQTMMSVCPHCRGEQNQLKGVSRAYFWVNNPTVSPTGTQSPTLTPTKAPTAKPTATPINHNNDE